MIAPTTPPTGMRDLLPDEVELRDAAIARILAVYIAHGFRRIETPALEHLRLLTRSEGGENEKLIFKVLKRGESLSGALESGAELADLGLRFDLTVPLARYYANNHARLPNPLKAIQVGPVWRAERNQRGRFRQFTQCDIDILGVASEVADVELILATCEALLALGLAHPRVRINDRRILTLIARHCGLDEDRHTAFFISFDKLEKVGRAGVLSELASAQVDRAAIDRFSALLDEFEAPGGMTLSRLRDLLSTLPRFDPRAFEQLGRIIDTVGAQSAGGFGIEFDARLVRGMGYYTGPIFEVSYADYPSSIAGGGRYDHMIGKLLGRDVPASGFSIGFERLVAILMERPGQPADTAGGDVVLTPARQRIALLLDEQASGLAGALEQARRLRAAGAIVSLEIKRKNVRRQLDELAAHGFSAYGLVEPGRASIDVKPLRVGGRAASAMVDSPQDDRR